VLRIRCAGGSGSRTMITCSLSNCVDGFHRAKFSASHATLDPDRACSAAQGGTLSLSKAAIRLTQMMKAGDTFLCVPCNPANHNHRRPQCAITMTALQHLIELRRILVFGAGVLP
jgi:hypothetical protein